MTRVVSHYITRTTKLASLIRRLDDLDRRLSEFTQGDLRGKMSGEDRTRLGRMQQQLRGVRERLENRMAFRPLPRPRRRAP